MHDANAFLRPRRLRRSSRLRDAVADVSIPPSSLIYPIFVTAGSTPRPVGSMPGIEQLPVSIALERMQGWRELGLRQFLLFGVTPTERKDARGSFAAEPEAPVQQLLRAPVHDGHDGVVLHADDQS